MVRRDTLFKLFLLLLSGAKLGKVLLSGGTMLLSVLAYTWIFGWKYAVGFVGMLVVHELGHFLAARYKGMDVGLPTFIPFVGAWVSLKDQPRNAETEAFIGLAGPLVGTVGATVCYFMARSYGSDILLAVAYSGFMLNLVNLIPLMPLDGGRVTAVLSPRVWLLGVPMLVALFLYRPGPLLILIGLLALPHVMKAWHYRDDSEEARHYYSVPAAVKWEYGAYYLALVGFLAVMAHDVHDMLAASRQMGGGTV